MWMRLVSGSSMFIDSSRSMSALFRPIELVMPSLHESVPGQETVSTISAAPREPEVELLQLLPDLVDRLVADPAQHQVLLDGHAQRRRRCTRA